MASGAPAYQWLLFDADGTLFDYDRAEGQALTNTFRHFGSDFSPAHVEHYRRINQELWRAVERGAITPGALKVRRFELLLERLGIRHSPAEFSEVYLAQLAACSELIDGAEDLVRRLHADHQIAVLTNGLSAVQRPRLERSVIRGFISAIVISEEIGSAKPDAAFFEHAWRQMGSPAKSKMLMIGDNWSSDIQGAANFGIAACWFNPGRQPRPAAPPIAHEIHRLPDLMKVLDS